MLLVSRAVRTTAAAGYVYLSIEAFLKFESLQVCECPALWHVRSLEVGSACNASFGTQMASNAHTVCVLAFCSFPPNGASSIWLEAAVRKQAVGILQKKHKLWQSITTS